MAGGREWARDRRAAVFQGTPAEIAQTRDVKNNFSSAPVKARSELG